jgi:hypothetical protein
VRNTTGSACLTMTATTLNRIMTTTNTTMRRMGSGKGSCEGADDGGESNYNGRDVLCGLSVKGMGWRMLIVGPHAAVVDNNDNNDCHRRGGGVLPPPPLVRPVLLDAFLLSSILLTAVNSCSTRAFGAWSYGWWRRRKSAPLYSFVRFRSTLWWTVGGRGAA